MLDTISSTPGTKLVNSPSTPPERNIFWDSVQRNDTDSRRLGAATEALRVAKVAKASGITDLAGLRSVMEDYVGETPLGLHLQEARASRADETVETPTERAFATLVRYFELGLTLKEIIKTLKKSQSDLKQEVRESGHEVIRITTAATRAHKVLRS